MAMHKTKRFFWISRFPDHPADIDHDPVGNKRRPFTGKILLFTIGGMAGKTAHPWIDLYQYGNIPPLTLSLYGLVVFVFGFLFRKMAPTGKSACFWSFIWF